MQTPAFTTLILCKSVHHQNTLRVAKAIGEPLAACVLEPEHASHALVEQYDLIGFGSGVYFGRLHPALFEWLDALPAALAAGPKPAFLFSTAGLSMMSAVWQAPLKKHLVTKGFDVVAEFHCRGFDTWGPLWLTGGINKSHPDHRDLERAATFARRLIDSCRFPGDPSR